MPWSMPLDLVPLDSRLLLRLSLYLRGKPKRVMKSRRLRRARMSTGWRLRLMQPIVGYRRSSWIGAIRVSHNMPMSNGKAG